MINTARANPAFIQMFPNNDRYMMSDFYCSILFVILCKNQKCEFKFTTTRFRMFALLRSFTEAGAGTRTFQVLQWDENEDNQVVELCFIGFVFYHSFRQ